MFNKTSNENYNKNKDAYCGFGDIIAVLDDLEKYDKYIDNRSILGYYTSIKACTCIKERGSY